MKSVYTSPARKAGVAIAAWWKGIVVLMPSITNSPRARSARASASARSRPQTMSFATSES